MDINYYYHYQILLNGILCNLKIDKLNQKRDEFWAKKNPMVTLIIRHGE